MLMISNGRRQFLTFALAIMAVAAAAGVAIGIANASADSSKVKDPKGDATTEMATLDIVKATVAKKNDLFELTIKVDEEIPNPIPEGQQWNFVLDTDPAVCQEWLGCDPDDYLVGLQPNPATGEHVAVVVHLTNPPPFDIQFVPFEVSGKKIRLSVQEDLIGDPASMTWYANTRPGPFPAPTTDDAPDGADNGIVEWAE